MTFFSILTPTTVTQLAKKNPTVKNVRDKNYFLLCAVGFKQCHKHNFTAKPEMTSVRVLGTTLIYVAHNNLLLIKSVTILVVYAFKHKFKQSNSFRQLEESLRFAASSSWSAQSSNSKPAQKQVQWRRFLFSSALLFAYRGEYGTAGGGGMYRSKIAGFSFFSEVSTVLSGGWVEAGGGLVWNVRQLSKIWAFI